MEAVRLEDNRDYLILDTIKINGIDYVYLSLVTKTEERRVCIRKVVDYGENLVGLDSEVEYKTALNTYVNKYKDIINAA